MPASDVAITDRGPAVIEGNVQSGCDMIQRTMTNRSAVNAWDNPAITVGMSVGIRSRARCAGSDHIISDEVTAGDGNRAGTKSPPDPG